CAQFESGQSVQAADQEAAEIGHEWSHPRLVREALPTELVGLGVGILYEVGIAALEPTKGAGAITIPGCVHAQQRRKHWRANELVGPLQIELNGAALEGGIDPIVDGKEPRQRLGSRGRAPFLVGRVPVVVLDKAEAAIDREVEMTGDFVPAFGAAALQSSGKAGRLVQNPGSGTVDVGV